MFKPGGSNEPPDLSYIYIYILTFFFSLKKKKIFEHPSPKFYLNPTKINLNVIILMLFSW